jgi:two-component system, OmpR family, phosphate regulon response regulator PhoB
MAWLIQIVDDDAELVKVLATRLKKEGYQTRSAFTGKAALEEASKEPLPDLILLDLLLPDLPGLEVCKLIRQHPRIRHVPVIIVSALSEEIDRVVGFEIGADDYVCKPFSTRELLLRIRALLRRVEPVQSASEPICFGKLRVEESAHRIWIGEEEIYLTALELRLLIKLITRKGQVQSREVLLIEVWGSGPDLETRTIDTSVKRLRQKLKDAGDYIETVRGVGYRLKATPEEEGL